MAHKLQQKLRFSDIFPTKILVDSSVWVAFWRTDDSQHKKAVKVIEEFSKKAILYFHPVVVMEILTVLRAYKTSRVDQIYEDIIKGVYGLFDESPIDLLSIKPFFERFPHLSMTDAFLLYIALNSNYLILTFDKKLQKAAEQLNVSIVV